MRRLLVTATLSALLVAPVWGQRGTGARMGGGGFSHGPGFSGRAFSGRSSFVGHQPAFGARTSVFTGYRFGRFDGRFRGRFFPGGFHNRFFFSVGLGYPFAYPYYYGGYYYPYAYAPAYTYPPAYAYPPAYDDASDTDERRRLEYEIERLNQKIDRLNAEREPAVGDRYEGKQLNKNGIAGKPKTVVLVFRDKHVQEVENYAVVGNTLWWFSEQRAKKIPLNELDLVATAKLNDERGIAFPLPPTAEKKK
jgi:hypothetical protein